VTGRACLGPFSPGSTGRGRSEAVVATLATTAASGRDEAGGYRGSCPRGRSGRTGRISGTSGRGRRQYGRPRPRRRRRDRRRQASGADRWTGRGGHGSRNSGGRRRRRGRHGRWDPSDLGGGKRHPPHPTMAALGWGVGAPPSPSRTEPPGGIGQFGAHRHGRHALGDGH